jgi:hypothetical protein
MDAEVRDWYLTLLTSQYTINQTNSSVLDSGSARHLQSSVCVTDVENTTPLSGFDGSIKWTEGSGYVPAEMRDCTTGSAFMIDFEGVDVMTKDLISNIWSMGRMIKDGWGFHLSNDSCYGTTPGGAHQVEVQLGIDNILRTSHEMRTARERVPLPKQGTIHTVKKSASDATASFLHDCFFHRGDEKISMTLRMTKGYVPVKVVTGYCDACATAKARDFGLSQKRHQPQEIMPVQKHDPVFDDDDNSVEADSDMSDEEPQDFAADVIGRRLGEQSVPRFDIEALRPFEAVFVDNKDYPCSVRGGAQSCLLFVDYKSRTKHKIDIRSKTENGSAFRRVAVREGMHKLPYTCRVYSDGCGSMKHVEDTAVLMGIDHQYIPPHQQSLNEAEKVCDSIFAETRAAMVHHNVPYAWFSLMVDFAMYTDIRTATTASRGWMTPHEITRSVVPFIGNLHRPCTRCFVNVPKSKRKQLAAQGLSHFRAEPGRLVGFHGPYSATYAVMLDAVRPGQRDRLVHSRNVSFNDADYVMPAVQSAPGRARSAVNFEGRPVSSEEANSTGDDTISEDTSTHRRTNEDAFDSERVTAPMPNREGCFDLDAEANQQWFTHANAPKDRPRPSYSKMCAVMK